MIPPVLAFLSLGFPEMLVIGFVALLVFGGRLPEVMRNLGRSYAKFRQGMHEVARPIRDEMRRIDHETTRRPVPAPLPPPADVYATGIDPALAHVPEPVGTEGLDDAVAGGPVAPEKAPPAPQAARPKPERPPAVIDEPPPV